MNKEKIDNIIKNTNKIKYEVNTELTFLENKDSKYIYDTMDVIMKYSDFINILNINGNEEESKEYGKSLVGGNNVITLKSPQTIMTLAQKENQAGAAVAVAEYFPPTGTKVYMNLGDPELAEKYSSLPCDGIGLIREEFIWTTYIHEHPLYLIKTGHPEKVVDQLAEGMRQVCQAMAPRPVTLRFSDFKSSEYRDLKGGDEFEPYEPSALLGWRGASRYYDPKSFLKLKLFICVAF